MPNFLRLHSKKHKFFFLLVSFLFLFFVIHFGLREEDFAYPTSDPSEGPDVGLLVPSAMDIHLEDDGDGSSASASALLRLFSFVLLHRRLSSGGYTKGIEQPYVCINTQ